MTCRIIFAALTVAVLLSENSGLAQPALPGITLDTLRPNVTVEGFRTVAVYLNDSGARMGARFIHPRTGFTLDVLTIQSVPQAYIWVNTYPTSDMGEPHTQEHLLLGHGNKGRNVAGVESMSMVQMTAYTQQRRTVYEFNTSAGPDVFFRILALKLDALLHPDYTDEEIRREVRNFGVTENASDKSLRVEEKGSVYNEMVSSTTQPARRVFRSMNQALYGSEHPLSYNAGGEPAAIRVIKPEHIRKFHADHYHLANMGMIASVPKQVSLSGALTKIGEIVDRVQPGTERRHVVTGKDLPPPQPVPAGEVRIVDYPHRSDQQPGMVMFSWPASLNLSVRDRLLADLFLETFAGDPTTNIYKLFVDTKTRKMDIGARGAFGYLNDELGNPIYIGLTDVTPASMDQATLGRARELIASELQHVAAMADGSPELAEFNGRALTRVTEWKRTLGYLINTPPQFGFRTGSRPWMMHLRDLNELDGFEKSVTMKPLAAEVQELLGSRENIWRKLLPAWRLSTAEPYIAAARPNPALIKSDEDERLQRAAAEVARLRSQYGVSDDQEVIRRYKFDYDAATEAIERNKKSATNRFLDNPPLTLDDPLEYRTAARSGVPILTATFDSMTSATAGLALRADAVPDSELVYLAALPTLLTHTGVIRDGRAVPYEEMSELLRKEILSLTAAFSSNPKTGRVELMVRGSGNDTAEAQRALEWMRLVLTAPNWRTENLPRIRDVVDQALSATRRTMQTAEENWVQMPANAWLRDDLPVFATATNFLTRSHHLFRLRWMLKDTGNAADREALTTFLTGVAAASGRSRLELKAHLSAAQKPTLVGDAAKDLEQLLADLPDASLAADLSYLCRQMRGDFLAGPDRALAGLNSVRTRLLRTGGARLFVVGSKPSQDGLQASIQSLVGVLSKGAVEVPARLPVRVVQARLADRESKPVHPAFVGLVAAGMTGGVIMNSAAGVDYGRTDREALLDYLASIQYSGSGAHSAFMRTWGAGLAYSNGLGNSPHLGRMRYYAERTPELPQTLKFVVELIRNGKHDPNIAEYAIAQAFTSRAQDAYERRAEAMAEDLADGITPEAVAKFRRSVLELRRLPTLSEELHSRAEKVYARILPGLGVSVKDVNGGSYFVIGPERQLGLYEQYLKSVQGTDTTLYRLYPRDFWITPN